MSGVSDPSSIKYQVKAKINADGIVDKPDVVGAIFGQTEGLLGDNLDLRDLQKSGRIGRVEVEIVSKGGKSEGILYMSSSLDQVETAIIAATLETIDRVGPCKASIKVIGIEDVRVTKREQIAERAKELLGILMDQAKGSGSNLTQNIRESLQVEEITTYGKERCPAGPNVKNSEAIIIVEGRSDVLNLLRAGIKNAIAVEGTNIPKSVQDLSKERVTTAFVDGDRGGELILRELFQTSDIDYVARAPRAHEVEELSAKQLVKCLRNKVPGDQYMEMNGLSFEEKELSEDAENDLRDRHVRKNAEEFVQEDEPAEEEPSFKIRRANGDDSEEDSRFGRNRRERRQRNDDDDSRGRNRRERHTRKSAEETAEEMGVSGRRFERKRREFSRRDSEFDEEPVEERPVRNRRKFEEEPETESVVTETEEGEIIIDEVEVSEERTEEPAAEEPVIEEPVEEVTETAEEPVEEEIPEVKEEPEPVVEEAPAEVKEEEPVEEEPKRAIRAPVKRKSSKKDKVLTEEQENYKAILSEISGTKNSVLIDGEGNQLDKVEVKNLANYLKESTAENITTIVFDGVISQNILDIASGKGIKTLVGKNKGKIAKLPAEITIWTRTDLL
ncbi:DNA primase DnaG [methanogenic archaeon ISO4-H5]|nr:DNA primase DnaG [methanogenic archaeon ISO4-H5]